MYLAAFDEDWKRWELPFPKNKQDFRPSALSGVASGLAVVAPAKEFKQFVLFDKALRGAQSDEKDAGRRDTQGFCTRFPFRLVLPALARSQNVLTKNVNAAARVALDMTTDSGRLWHCILKCLAQTSVHLRLCLGQTAELFVKSLLQDPCRVWTALRWKPS